MTKRYFKDNGLLAVPFDKGTGMCDEKVYLRRNVKRSSEFGTVCENKSNP